MANLDGTLEGQCRDSTMMQETGLLNDLMRVALYNGEPCFVYGNQAYPLGLHLQAPFRNMNLQ